MRTFLKYIVLVIVISIVSYSLQILWVKLVEPIMESNGIMFQGILPEGQIISGIAVILINIVGAVVLGVLFNGNIPIWLCLFYNILYTVFLLIYSPGRLEFHLSDNFFTSVPFMAFLLDMIPFVIARICIQGQKG